MERIEIRPLQWEDSIPMYLLRTSDDVVRVSLNPVPTKAQHDEFLEDIESGNRYPIHVATVDDLFAGCCSTNENGHVNIMVAAPYRRMGIATKLLKHLQSLHTNLVAWIHKDNVDSLVLFTKCGFEVVLHENPYKVLVWFKEDYDSTCSHDVDDSVL